MKSLILFLISFSLVCCSRHSESSSAKPLRYHGTYTWPPTPYTKVVGYQFKIPKLPDDLLIDGALDVERLKRHMTKSAELDNEQVSQLLGAVLEPQNAVGPAFCFSPHHIFVFYGVDQAPVAAIEICFGCMNLRAWPHAASSSGGYDFETPANLAVDLGLGLGSTHSKVNLKDYLDTVHASLDPTPSSTAPLLKPLR